MNKELENLYEEIKKYQDDCLKQKQNWCGRTLSKYWQQLNELVEYYPVNKITWRKKEIENLAQKIYPVDSITFLPKLPRFFFREIGEYYKKTLFLFLFKYFPSFFLEIKAVKSAISYHSNIIEKEENLYRNTNEVLNSIVRIPHICFYCKKKGKEHILSSSNISAVLNEITKECITGID